MGSSPKIDLSRGKFKSQVGKMMCLVDTVRLSPASAATSWWVHVQMGHGVQNGSYLCSQKHDFPSTKPIPLAPAECPVCSSRDRLSLWCGTIPG